MDKITELAELFKDRDNPKNYAPMIGTHVGDGKLRIRSNVILSKYKTTVGNISGSDNGTQFVILPMGREFVVIGRLT